MNPLLGLIKKKKWEPVSFWWRFRGAKQYIAARRNDPLKHNQIRTGPSSSQESFLNVADAELTNSKVASVGPATETHRKNLFSLRNGSGLCDSSTIPMNDFREQGLQNENLKKKTFFFAMRWRFLLLLYKNKSLFSIIIKGHLTVNKNTSVHTYT